MPPWEAALLWIGDAIALVWFLQFVATHLFQGRPLRSRSWSEFKREKEWVVALVSLLLGAGLDLAITLLEMHKDKAGFASAEVAGGTVHSVQSRAGNERAFYELRCRYPDKQGQWYEGRFCVEEDFNAGFAAAVPPQTVQALWNGQVPFGVRVSYDPDRPERSWLTDFGWHDGNRLYYFSLIVLAIQGLGLLLFVEFLAMVTYHTGRVPWWFDLYKAFPFLVEVGLIGLIGPLFRFFAVGAVWV
jgi:hypothetical protein